MEPPERRKSQFESLVNTEGFQTSPVKKLRRSWFESLVNTEGFQTCEIWR